MNERLAGKLALKSSSQKDAATCQKADDRRKIACRFNELAHRRPEKPIAQSPARRAEALAAQAKNVYIRRD